VLIELDGGEVVGACRGGARGRGGWLRCRRWLGGLGLGLESVEGQLQVLACILLRLLLGGADGGHLLGFEGDGARRRGDGLGCGSGWSAGGSLLLGLRALLEPPGHHEAERGEGVAGRAVDLHGRDGLGVDERADGAVEGLGRDAEGGGELVVACGALAPDGGEDGGSVVGLGRGGGSFVALGLLERGAGELHEGAKMGVELGQLGRQLELLRLAEDAAEALAELPGTLRVGCRHEIGGLLGRAAQQAARGLGVACPERFGELDDECAGHRVPWLPRRGARTHVRL
jgi:hypothetical protein